jgi:uncharacterized protein (DUF1501 family)
VLAIRDLASFGAGAHGGTVATGGRFEDMYADAADTVMRGTGRSSFGALALLDKAQPTKIAPRAGVTYPTGAFGRSLMQAAQLIKAKLGARVIFVEIDGWDTHASQGGANGALAGRLNDFARGLRAFHDDLGERMAETAVVSMTEFGRAVDQNGNRGTDHGHASAFFVLGGGVRGGKVYARWPGLADAQLFESRDLAVTTDYRDVLGELCTAHLGLTKDALGSVFPGYAPSTLGLFAA